MTQPLQIIIGTDGAIRHVRADELTELATQFGSSTVRRASHVDPTGDLTAAAISWLATNAHSSTLPDAWWADMLPVKGPVLGPFASHKEAIAAELAWLSSHHIPTPQG